MRGIPQCDTPDFIITPVLSDIFNHSNFEYSTYSGLKVDSLRKEKARKMKNSIQVGLNEHNQKTIDNERKNHKSFSINIGSYRDILVQNSPLSAHVRPVKFWSQDWAP